PVPDSGPVQRNGRSCSLRRLDHASAVRCAGCRRRSTTRALEGGSRGGAGREPGPVPAACPRRGLVGGLLAPRVRRPGVPRMLSAELTRPWYASPYTGLFRESGPVPRTAYDPDVCVWSGVAPLPDPDADAPASGGAAWDMRAAELAGVGEAI